MIAWVNFVPPPVMSDRVFGIFWSVSIDWSSVTMTTKLGRRSRPVADGAGAAIRMPARARTAMPTFLERASA